MGKNPATEKIVETRVEIAPRIRSKHIVPALGELLVLEEIESKDIATLHFSQDHVVTVANREVKVLVKTFSREFSRFKWCSFPGADQKRASTASGPNPLPILRQISVSTKMVEAG